MAPLGTQGWWLIPAHAGKTRVVVLRAGQVGGSSPLTRGKRCPGQTGLHPGRLIPAHAGKTKHVTAPVPPHPAHPRSRGENHDVQEIALAPVGSSPLTRGKLAANHRLEGIIRLIPAHAGKTADQLHVTTIRRAHPRSRGENPTGAPISIEARGSSPLTRGKPWSLLASGRFPGLIPAHAGKTLPDLRFYCADRSDLGNP